MKKQDLINTISELSEVKKSEVTKVLNTFFDFIPNKVKEAIPGLLENTNDKSTVIRWSSAFALTETAKGSKEAQKELVPEFKEILAREDNNGVRNIYLKYLKI